MEPESETKSDLSFRGYTSISNVDENAKVVQMQIENFFSPSVEWIYTEKVHGANFQIATNGRDIQYAKRTSVLSDGEKFFEWETIREKERAKALAMHRLLCEHYEAAIEEVVVFGEIFGGTYEHKDVPKTGLKHVQKGTLCLGLFN
jgi:Rnl2 family RNA ligase